MTYVSYRNEVETDFLIKKPLQRNQILAAPKTSGDEMNACRIKTWKPDRLRKKILRQIPRKLPKPENRPHIQKTHGTKIPRDKWDITTDKIITEQEVLKAVNLL